MFIVHIFFTMPMIAMFFGYLFPRLLESAETFLFIVCFALLFGMIYCCLSAVFKYFKYKSMQKDLQAREQALNEYRKLFFDYKN